MKFAKIFLIFFLLQTFAFARENFHSLSSKMQDYQFLPNLEQIKIFCDLNGGELIPNWTCPQSLKQRSDGPFCLLKDDRGRLQVTNGCTGSHDAATYFFKACVLHDFCYHNRAIQDGNTKEGCDNQFLENMKAICAEGSLAGTLNQGRCEFLAKNLFYRAVKKMGAKSWACSKEHVEYPTRLQDF